MHPSGISRPRCQVWLLLIVTVIVLQCLLLLRSPGNMTSIMCFGKNCDPMGRREDAQAAARSLEPATSRPALNRTLEKIQSLPGVVTALYDYIEHPRALCSRMVRIGGQLGYKSQFDGQKWVCMDREYSLASVDNCLIYSFGINNDWSFDDNAELLQCEIHAFDPSIGRKDHDRSSRIHFHNLGIGGRNENKTVKGRMWQVRRYADIVDMLGHKDRIVHYLKIDVEGSEWHFLADVIKNSPQLLRNVRQIGMEIHMGFGIPNINKLGVDGWRRYLKTFIDLEGQGFRLFHSEVNPYEKRAKLLSFTERKVSRVYEVVWLNQSR